MQQKSARPLFKQALSAVRKQVDSGAFNKKNTQDEKKDTVDDHFDDMSSGQRQRLKQLGVDIGKTKKIAKEQRNSNNRRQRQLQWKHDKYRPKQDFQRPKQKEVYKKSKSNFVIRFSTRQQYNKIYQIVKSEKAFIEQINQNYIKFTKQYAFNTCKSLLKSNGIEFQDETGGEQQNKATINVDKESIFNRLK